MALNAEEVRVGITGALYKAPLGTPKPANSLAVIDADYEHLGYFTDNGVVINYADSVDNIIAWQNAQVVRSSVTESITTIAFTPIQTRGAVLETFHRGSTVEETSAGHYEIAIRPVNADPATWLFDAIDGDKHIRFWIPNGEVTERGEEMYANGSPVGYPMTVTFYPDENGDLARKMSNDLAWAEGILAS